jgi:hypothetical protein
MSPWDMLYMPSVALIHRETTSNRQLGELIPLTSGIIHRDEVV